MTKLPEAVESAIAMLDTEIVPRGAGAYVTLYGVEELRAAIAAAIAAAIEAEREACADLVHARPWEDLYELAGAIRARGNES